MTRHVCIVVLFILIFGMTIGVSSAVSVIIGFKDKADTELVKQHGTIKYNYKHIPAIAANIPEVAIDKISQNSKVAYIEPDYDMKLLADEVGWGVSRISANSVHASTMGASVKIAIVDTGIDYTHTDLNDNYCGGYDFVNGDNDPMDDHWHGTHCAGIVAAAGNDGNADGTGDCVDYPANYDSVIAVASVYSPDVRSGYSSTGPAVELAAPGATIYSTIPGNSYQYASGTSMACPHVAGTAALVWALNPSWDNEQVRTRMQETAEDLGDVGRDTWYGFGLINASAAAINIPEATPSEMFVDNINMSLQKSGTNTRALAAVNVIDVTGAPVNGVVVTGSWSGLAKNVVSGTTDSNGKVLLTSNWVKRVKQGTFTFTVNNMTKDGWIYNPTYPSASISITR